MNYFDLDRIVISNINYIEVHFFELLFILVNMLKSEILSVIISRIQIDKYIKWISLF